jgi:hypothetical protein
MPFLNFANLYRTPDFNEEEERKRRMRPPPLALPGRGGDPPLTKVNYSPAMPEAPPLARPAPQY